MYMNNFLKTKTINGIKYYILEKDTPIYRGDSTFNIDNGLEQKSTFFGFTPTDVEKYGIVYQFETAVDISLVAIDAQDNDVLFNTSTGTALFVYGGYSNNGSAGDAYFVDVTQDNIFNKPNGSGVVSNVFSRTPATPSAPTQNGAPQSTEAYISITSDTRVTRTLQVSRSVSPYTSYSGVGTVTPTSNGSEGDTSVVTNFTDTTVSANTSYRYKVRGVNNSFDGSLSAQSAIITTAALGTSLSYSNVASIAGLGTTPPPREPIIVF